MSKTINPFPIAAIDTVFGSPATFVDNARRIECIQHFQFSELRPQTLLSYTDFITSICKYHLSLHSIADAFNVELVKAEQWLKGQRLPPPEVAWYFVEGRWDALRSRLLSRGDDTGQVNFKKESETVWYEWKYDNKTVGF